MARLARSLTPLQPERHRRRLRVVTLVDSLGLAGGGERLARDITVGLDPERFERTLCVSRWFEESSGVPGAQDALDELRATGVRFIGLDRRSSRQVRAWRPLLSELRGGRVDVLHAHKFGSNVWASILGWAARTPVVVAHEHTWSFDGQPLRRFLDRNLIARRVDAFLTVSMEDRRRMIEIERIPPEKLVFVPNGIPPSPPPTGRDIRSELGIPRDAVIVGTVATLRPQKALDVLVRAADLLRDRTDLRFVMVGEGDERESLERLVAELHLEPTVTLAGYRPDVPDLLDAFDVAVCSSDFEGTPLSILEYMDAALPVVSTRVGGVPDLIEPGVQGLLVPPRDPAALAAAIRELAEDRERATAMGLESRRRRREEFGIEVTVGRIESLYETLWERVGSRA